MDFFELHPSLAKKTILYELSLCSVLLEDNSNHPWIILVPRRINVSKIMDLKADDQLNLIKELDLAQNIMWKLFNPTQLNVAAIGNKTPQLHVHVIARFETDSAWPNTVWDKAKTPYTSEKKEELENILQQCFKANSFESICLSCKDG